MSKKAEDVINAYAVVAPFLDEFLGDDAVVADHYFKYCDGIEYDDDGEVLEYTSCPVCVDGGEYYSMETILDRDELDD